MKDETTHFSNIDLSTTARLYHIDCPERPLNSRKGLVYSHLVECGCHSSYWESASQCNKQ
uniref:Uncharacterized protein n=1 Tax=Utricularia reniformis TaxID=192314 RepID=A0A1Y0B2Q4_9LAMI|nr:hypothetical protein AEK19_MT1484 [Utricularia reniformis]ART31674.1 hypothetical protein AEK19_MT1484 [Utricularia reniformis]